jgi:WD40 repeat protein
MNNGTPEIWDATTGSVILSLKPAHTATVRRVKFSPDGTRCITGGFDHEVKVWDVATGELIHIIKENKDKIKGMDYSVDGNKIVSASADTSLKVWRSSDFSLV